MHSVEIHEVLRDIQTGGAWLSSARVVRCWVKSRNERNPCIYLLRKSTLARLPLTKRRKVGTMCRIKRTEIVICFTRASGVIIIIDVDAVPVIFDLII